ncbi:MAG: acireductone synthase [Candidatus Sulfotelmatobacter sp.]
MNQIQLDRGVSSILLDIEGTTTPLDLVHEVLFPFARLHLRRFLSEHRSSPNVVVDIAKLHEEWLADVCQGLAAPPSQTKGLDVESLVEYIERLMDDDRKSTPLKSLQGKIWEEGYRCGQLKGQVFRDVPPALQRWRTANKNVAIFSSGSVQAQQLLFANTAAGDLRKYISHYFDTTTGSKLDERSYAEIANVLRWTPAEIVFISDVARELDAARSVGFATLLSIRPGNRPQQEGTHVVIRSLDEVFP